MKSINMFFIYINSTNLIMYNINKEYYHPKYHITELKTHIRFLDLISTIFKKECKY